MSSSICVSDGILVVNKPSGPTSNFILQKLKRHLGAKKAGFTGTLDPLASGVLPICLGEATKVARFLTDFDKIYRAKIKLGECTSTGDCEGEVIQSRPVSIDRNTVKSVSESFVGVSEQLPPMYSAIKHNGKPLYKYARQGVDIERKVRSIEIKNLQFLGLVNDVAEIVVECTKGTYIRTLAEDIGSALGCGAHIIELERLAVGPFARDQSVTFDALMDASISQLEVDDQILPVERGVAHMPRVYLKDEECEKVGFGQKIVVADIDVIGWVALFRSENQKLVGIGERAISGKISPKRLINSNLSG